MNITIICDYSKEIGLGHFRRCKCINDELLLRNHKTRFIVNTNYEIFDLKGLDALQIDNFACLETVDLDSDELVMIDIGGKDITGIHLFLNRFPKTKIVIYDYLDRLILDYDLKVQPWPKLDGLNKNIASGLDYHVFSTEMYKLSRSKKIVQTVKKVLITFGGVDACNLSAKISDYMAGSFNDLVFGVVVGPGFSKKVKIELNFLERKYPNLILHRSPKSLELLYMEYDVGIISGGQTKFELALFGIPSLIIGSSKLEDDLSAEFSKLGCSKWICNGDHLMLNKINSYFVDVVNNYEAMAERGRRIFKGNGTDSLIKKLYEVEMGLGRQAVCKVPIREMCND